MLFLFCIAFLYKIKQFSYFMINAQKLKNRKLVIVYEKVIYIDNF